MRHANHEIPLPKIPVTHPLKGFTVFMRDAKGNDFKVPVALRTDKICAAQAARQHHPGCTVLVTVAI
jgi:hypothetical protein